MGKIKSTKRGDGRLMRTVTDPRTGKRIFVYGKSERELNHKLLDYSAKADSGRTFEEVAKDWWEEAEPKLAAQSVKPYKPALKRATNEFGETNIKEITTRQINGLINRLAKKGFARKTLSTQRLVVKHIFDYAVLQDDVQYNPCTLTTIPNSAPKSIRKAASTDNEKTVRSSADVWLFPFIALMTGMRRGEILALQWRDIDFVNNNITVTRSVYYSGLNYFYKEPKTEAGKRIVPLLLPLKDELLKIKDRKPDGLILPNDKGEPYTDGQYQTHFKHFREKTGITCTAHQLRHSFATIAFECGLPPKTIQEILGHKQLATTMDIYTDFREKALKDAEKTLNKNFMLS